MDRLFPRMSWSMGFGLDPVRDFQCSRCIEGKAEVGGGAAFELAAPVIVYGLGKGVLGVSSVYAPRYRFGPAAVAGLLLGAGGGLSLHTSAQYYLPVLGATSGYAQATAEGRYSISQQVEARLRFDATKTSTSTGITMNVYY